MRYIDPNLEMTPVVLFTLLLVSKRYHEVVDHYLLLAYIIVKHWRLTIILSFINVGQRTKISKTIKARTTAIFFTLRLNRSIKSQCIDSQLETTL